MVDKYGQVITISHFLPVNQGAILVETKMIRITGNEFLFTQQLFESRLTDNFRCV